MKRLFTLIVLVAAASSAFAQKPDLSPLLMPKTPAGADFVSKTINEIAVAPTRDSEVVVWTDNMDDESTWDVDNSAGAFGWDFQVASDQQGWFDGAFASFASASGGQFAFVGNENDDPNNAVFAEYTMTTAESISLVDMDAALLEFYLYGAKFTDTLITQISFDGTSFMNIANTDDLQQLTIFSGDVFPNPSIRRYNLTEYLPQDEVWIRFKWTGTIGYGMMVDDVSIIDPVDYDLEVMEVWHGDIINDYEYTSIPLEQSDPQVVGMSYRNMGGMPATNVRLHATHTQDGNVEFDGMSDPVEIVMPGESDTIWFTTTYIPDALGEIDVDIDAMMDSTDLCPDDNLGSSFFQMTEDFWGNENYDNLNLTFDGTGGIIGVVPEDDYMVGTAFTVNSPGSAYELVQYRIATGTTLPQLVAFELYQLDFETFDFFALAYTEWELGPADLSGWSALASDQTFDLEEGATYVLVLVHTSGEPLFLRGSAGDDDFSTWINGPYAAGGDVAWFVMDDYSPAIRMGLNGEVGVPDVSPVDMSKMLNQNFPNPFGGTSTVSYSVNTPGQVTLELRDATGNLVRVMDQGSLPAGKHQIQLDAASLAAGMYEYTLITPDGKTTKKLMVQK